MRHVTKIGIAGILAGVLALNVTSIAYGQEQGPVDFSYKLQGQLYEDQVSYQFELLGLNVTNYEPLGNGSVLVEGVRA